MATNFPGSLDNSTSLPYPTALSARNGPSLAQGQDNQNDALIAVETKLGTGSSTATSGNLLIGTGSGTSAWSKAAPTGTIVGTSDSQTLTNKTLTSPTINSPVITNANITADTLAGFTTANTGSVYGMSVSAGVLNSAALLNAVNTAALQTASVTPEKLFSGTGTTWPWQTYAVTWTGSTANPAIGNGTLAGKYTQVGKTVICKVEITTGTTTTYGTGTWQFSLPVTPKSERFVGSGVALRTGTQFYYGLSTNTDVNFNLVTTYMIIIQAGGAVGSATATWASGDKIVLELGYEAA